MRSSSSSSSSRIVVGGVRPKLFLRQQHLDRIRQENVAKALQRRESQQHYEPKQNIHDESESSMSSISDLSDSFEESDEDDNSENDRMIPYSTTQKQSLPFSKNIKPLPLDKENEYLKYKDIKQHLIQSLKRIKNNPGEFGKVYVKHTKDKQDTDKKHEDTSIIDTPPPPIEPPKKQPNSIPAKIPNSYPMGKLDHELKYRKSCVHPKTGRKCSIWETSTGLKGAALATGGKTIWMFDHEEGRWEKIERGRFKRFLEKVEKSSFDSVKFDLTEDTKHDVQWNTSDLKLIKML
jgi:hypothetical protein